jgi:hypothetical protein
MKTTTYNDEATPWNRSSYVLGTTLLPSSDDSNNNFSGAPEEPELR